MHAMWLWGEAALVISKVVVRLTPKQLTRQRPGPRPWGHTHWAYLQYHPAHECAAKLELRTISYYGRE